MFSFWHKSEFSKLNRWIGSRVRSAREESGITQEQLAKTVYKSRVNISNIERGEVAVAADDLSLIAHVLEKPITYFFPIGVRGATPQDLTTEEKELIHHFRQIQNAAMEKYAIKQVKALASAAIEADIQNQTEEP
jgi:transcriptional regulator with XRE-family HTH domain